MAKLQMKSDITHKLKLPLILTLTHSIMKQLGFAEYINDNVSWDPDHWEVSPRDLAQLLVLSTFTDIRTPLTHLEDRFEGIDVSFFLSSASKSTTVNSFNAGRALERIGQADSEKMYQVMALSAIKQAGIPVFQKVQDGSTSDVVWNARAIDYLKGIQEKGFQYGVFVADSKLVTHDLVTSMNASHSRIPFVSRCPSNFEGKLEERCILKAYSECT